ncbi:Co2+/Mg2+ efflux protein ApaG [Parendozoicomonas sp. Alg238-R29]|uniref:Co2+/Mg2+ efflux protein ApaG n=1 Tax=Parendozoicomonas sp. Alg238-R29 TaxID=2993446 RepID=UPI00248E0407|nr:Co2+/Mg2+ efflux protein ApaG [Parendozoicomonas sp. Alg238-R29]
MENHRLIDVHVETEFLPERSSPAKKQYAFAYHITVSNKGDQGAKLLTRHWFIIDGDKHQQEVQGDGVIGQQPHILPGDSYSYSSGCILSTPVGCMHGSYQMLDDTGEFFDARIPLFSLQVPGSVN